MKNFTVLLSRLYVIEIKRFQRQGFVGDSRALVIIPRQLWLRPCAMQLHFILLVERRSSPLAVSINCECKVPTNPTERPFTSMLRHPRSAAARLHADETTYRPRVRTRIGEWGLYDAIARSIAGLEHSCIYRTNCHRKPTRSSAQF